MARLTPPKKAQGPAEPMEASKSGGDVERARAREWADANGFMANWGRGPGIEAIQRDDPVWEHAWEGRDDDLAEALRSRPELALSWAPGRGAARADSLAVLAADHCCFESAKLCVELGADPRWRSNDGRGLLLAAAAGVGAGASHRLLDNVDPVRLGERREGFLSWLRIRAPELWRSGYDAAVLVEGSRYFCAAKELLACARAGADFGAPSKAVAIARALEVSSRGWQGPAVDLLSEGRPHCKGAAAKLAAGMLHWPEAGEALAAALEGPGWTRAALGTLSARSSKAKGDGAAIVKAAWERASLAEMRPRVGKDPGSKSRSRI